MGLGAFQLLCVLTLVVAYALELRRAAEPRRRLATVAALVVAAWLGEQSCISLHRFYGYAPGWWLRLGDVPALIPLIWPLVVLSADAVVRHFMPAGGRWRHAIAVGLVVTFDASLMEVVAVAAGYWRWVEGGYLGVPLMGVVGWGCFAAAATAWLGRDEAPSLTRLALVPLVAPAGAHLAIAAVWWSALRWTLRTELPRPQALVGFGVVAVVYSSVVLAARRSRPGLERDVVVSRAVATGVFVALLLALREPILFVHTGMVAAPYLVMLPRPTVAAEVAS